MAKPNAAISMALLLALTAIAVRSVGVEAQSESPAEAALSRLPPGYLSRDELPDGLALLPPPPGPDSEAQARDEEARASVLGARGTPRWVLAASDADLAFPHAAATFSCAVGVEIGSQTTPQLYGLLEKTLIDLGLSTYAAKTRYNRTRPFVVHNTSTCAPEDEEALRQDGSYPSGHSAVGWGWALVLAELAPARADAILRRGRDFGQSRLVCDVHWQSDIDAGRVIASATVARLHADAGFAADLAAARQEIASQTAAPARQACAAEAAALHATMKAAEASH